MTRTTSGATGPPRRGSRYRFVTPVGVPVRCALELGDERVVERLEAGSKPFELAVVEPIEHGRDQVLAKDVDLGDDLLGGLGRLDEHDAAVITGPDPFAVAAPLEPVDEARRLSHP